MPIHNRIYQTVIVGSTKSKTVRIFETCGVVEKTLLEIEKKLPSHEYVIAIIPYKVYSEILKYFKTYKVGKNTFYATKDMKKFTHWMKEGIDYYSWKRGYCF